MGQLKKVAALFLAVLMTVSLMAGCAQNVATSSADGGTSSKNASSEVEKHTLTAMVCESANTFCKFADRDKYLVWKEFSSQLESKGLEMMFEVIQQDQYATVLTTRLASLSDLPEYISLTGADDATMINCIEQGIFLPVNDLVDAGDGTAKAFLEKYPQAYKKCTYTDGKMYWMPSVQQTTYKGKLASTNVALMVRQDWLKLLNMETPDTLDEFTAYLKACQDKDLNGNGQKDEVYGQSWRDFSAGVAQWFGLPNDRFGMYSDSGKVVSTWELPGVKDYFRYAKTLIDQGLTSTDFIAASSSVCATYNANNQLSAYCSYCLETYVEPEIIVQQGAPDPLYVTVKPIQAVKGIDPVLGIESSQLTDNRRAAFTKNLKDPAAASIFLDTIYSDKFETLYMWGVEGVTFEERNGIRYLIGDATNDKWEAASISGNCTGDSIWGQAFPIISFNQFEQELAGVPEAKANVQLELLDYPHTMWNSMQGNMAIPTAEENKIIATYESSYLALSREIGVKLYKGEIDIDDNNAWENQVLKPLKDGGMDKLLKVYQARSDRYNRK